MTHDGDARGVIPEQLDDQLVHQVEGTETCARAPLLRPLADLLDERRRGGPEDIGAERCLGNCGGWASRSRDRKHARTRCRRVVA